MAENEDQKTITFCDSKCDPKSDPKTLLWKAHTKKSCHVEMFSAPLMGFGSAQLSNSESTQVSAKTRVREKQI